MIATLYSFFCCFQNSVSPFNVPKELVNRLQTNLNDSKVTDFPAGILNGANSSAVIKPASSITLQSSSNSSASQPQPEPQTRPQAQSSVATSSTSTTTETPVPMMH